MWRKNDSVREEVRGGKNPLQLLTWTVLDYEFVVTCDLHQNHLHEQRHNASLKPVPDTPRRIREEKNEKIIKTHNCQLVETVLDYEEKARTKHFTRIYSRTSLTMRNQERHTK